MKNRFKIKTKRPFIGLKEAFKNGNLIFLLLLIISACKTPKSVLSTTELDHTTIQTYIKSIIENTPLLDSFTSKMKLTVALNGKTLAINGNLKIKKNQVIQLSFVPLLGIEAARIEITPEHVLILDRMNKRYVQVPLSSLLKSLEETDMDFYTLQSLFLNELFIPGSQSVSSQDARKFIITQDANQILLQIKKSKNPGCSFFLSPLSGRLNESVITKYDQFQLQWKYNDFAPLNGKNFPTYMDISIIKNKTTARAELNLSKMNTRKDWEAVTSIPKKYEQINFNDLLKQLFK